MEVKPSDAPKEYIEAYIGYIYKNSVYWNMTAGELSAVLSELHHIWAGIADRHGDELRARLNVRTGRIGKRIYRDIRDQQVSNLEVHKLVLKMWQRIDRKLGLEPRADQYDQFIQPKLPSQENSQN